MCISQTGERLAQASDGIDPHKLPLGRARDPDATGGELELLPQAPTRDNPTWARGT